MKALISGLVEASYREAVRLYRQQCEGFPHRPFCSVHYETWWLRDRLGQPLAIVEVARKRVVVGQKAF